MQVCRGNCEYHRPRPPRRDIRGQGALSRDGQADVCQLVEDEEARKISGRAAEGRANWAGCASTRKSTNGGCIMVGDICVKA